MSLATGETIRAGDITNTRRGTGRVKSFTEVRFSTPLHPQWMKEGKFLMSRTTGFRPSKKYTRQVTGSTNTTLQIRLESIR